VRPGSFPQRPQNIVGKSSEEKGAGVIPKGQLFCIEVSDPQKKTIIGCQNPRRVFTGDKTGDRGHATEPDHPGDGQQFRRPKKKSVLDRESNIDKIAKEKRAGGTRRIQRGTMSPKGWMGAHKGEPEGSKHGGIGKVSIHAAI